MGCDEAGSNGNSVSASQPSVDGRDGSSSVSSSENTSGSASGAGSINRSQSAANSASGSGSGSGSDAGGDATILCGSSSCGSGLVCERNAGPACADPNWAEWPMPNAQVDVEAGAPNLESYTDNGDGTVMDNVTELVWQQAVPSAGYTQEGALAYCAGLRLDGYADWRLPSVVELVSIVDTSTFNPSINAAAFPGTPVDYYWSSTPYAGAPNSAWGVYFNNGYTDYNVASITYSVRCVR
jgi:hypothetical protein